MEIQYMCLSVNNLYAAFSIYGFQYAVKTCLCKTSDNTLMLNLYTP